MHRLTSTLLCVVMVVAATNAAEAQGAVLHQPDIDVALLKAATNAVRQELPQPMRLAQAQSSDARLNSAIPAGTLSSVAAETDTEQVNLHSILTECAGDRPATLDTGRKGGCSFGPGSVLAVLERPHYQSPDSASVLVQFWSDTPVASRQQNRDGRVYPPVYAETWRVFLVRRAGQAWVADRVTVGIRL